MLKRQFDLFSPPPTSKTLTLAPPYQNSAPTSTQSSIVGKFSKNFQHLKQESPDNFLKEIPLVGFCLSFVHQGVNKAISQEPPVKCINVVMRVSLLTTKMQTCI